MKSLRLTLLIVPLLLAATAVPAVDLYPTVNVTAATKTKAYLGYAAVTGYYELAPDGVTRITVMEQWTDTAAITAHVTQHLNEAMRQAYRVAKARQDQAALPPPETIAIP